MLILFKKTWLNLYTLIYNRVSEDSYFLFIKLKDLSIEELDKLDNLMRKSHRLSIPKCNLIRQPCHNCWLDNNLKFWYQVPIEIVL